MYSPSNYTKYPELQMYPEQYDPEYLLMFPVDTPNTIPIPANDFKQQQDVDSGARVEQSLGSSKAAESNCLLTKEQDFDLDALLAFPTPANKEQVYFPGDVSWELLEGLEQRNLEDIELINHLEAHFPDEIHYGHGLQKDASYQSGIAQVPEATPDQFGSPMMDQHSPTPMDHSGSMYHDPSPSPDASPPSDQYTETSPEDVTSPMADNMPSEVPSSATRRWGQNIQTLFEKTFNISDLTNEFMAIPPDMATITLDHKTRDKNKVPQRHTSPKNSPSFDRAAKSFKKYEHAEDDLEIKPKPTLLFGKHEGEIIHKLLALKQGTRSKPVTRDKLITMPVEDFNTLLEEVKLSEIEVAFMKEWRRRGKNKAAAQIARKRKREEVTDLDQEVINMQQQRSELEKRCSELQLLVVSLKARSKVAEEKLYKRQSAVAGRSVTHDTHHILITEDEQLLLIPRANSKKIVVAN